MEQARKQDELLDAQLRAEQCDVELVYDWDLSRQRDSLIADLYTASRGLDPGWTKRVCCLPEEELYARVRQIQSKLRRQETVAEMLTFAAAFDRPSSPPKSLWERIRGLFKRSPVSAESQSERPHACRMREWVEANMQPGDELWVYTWGGVGYAIVRDGEVVEWRGLFD